jgi:hypothetical protein
MARFDTAEAWLRLRGDLLAATECEEYAVMGGTWRRTLRLRSGPKITCIGMTPDQATLKLRQQVERWEDRRGL